MMPAIKNAKDGFIYNCNQGFITFSAERIECTSKPDGCYKKRPIGLPSGWVNFDENADDLFEDMNNNRHQVICVQTGKNSNISVLDFDVESTYDKMVKLVPNLADHYTVKTPRGYHVYFDYDESITTSTNVFSDYPGVDTRNDNGFVYAPGTQYQKPNGDIAQYEYIGGSLQSMPCEFARYFKSADISHVKEAEEVAVNDFSIIKALCKIIPIEFLENFQDWRKIMWAIHSEGVDEDFARTLSMKAENYTGEGFNNIWFKVPNECSLKIGTIHFYAKKGDSIEYNKIVSGSKTFRSIANEFEKNNFKILNGGYYIAISKNGTANMLSKTQMVERHEHIGHIVINEKKGESKNRCFIKDWITGNDSIKMFDAANVYPPGMEIPNNHFNLWEDFAMESVHSYKKEMDGFNFMRQHFRTLCDSDENFNYFEGWISQMITHPHRKSGIMPVFIGRQGTGKTSIAKCLEAMIGSNKMADVSNPDYVLGNFNESLLSSYLVHFTELSKSAIGSNDRLKELISDDMIQINQKGKKIVKINSFHRVIAFTNNEDPLQTSKDDRRNWIIRCNDELAGNKEYFDQFYKYLRDVNVMKTLYEYYKNEENATEFYSMSKPISAHHEELKRLNTPHIIQWLTSFIEEKIQTFELDGAEEPIIECQSSDLYKRFCEWRDVSNVKYEVSAMQFSCRLTNYKIDGIEKGQRSRNGSGKILHFHKILKFIEEKY